MAGRSTQEFSSCALSPLYPSYYKEFQVRNWTHVDIVITDNFGNQELVYASKEFIEREAQVQIESRFNNGSRLEHTKQGDREVPIPSKRTTISFDEIRQHPVKLDEYNLIISTYDQSDVAKDMVRNDRFNPRLLETRIDNELTDPRFVFQVIDPYNQFDALFVNVFGTTVILRAGYYGDIIPTSDSKLAQALKATLVCYLRYPTDYYDSVQDLQTVFEVELDPMNFGSPIRLPSGDVICIASNIDQLKKALAAKNSVTSAKVDLTGKMISKDLYDAAQKAAETEIERVKNESKVKLDTTIVEKDSEIAKLKAKVEAVTREKEAAEVRADRWQNINAADSKVKESEVKLSELHEKYRKEAYDANRKDIDNMWTVVKIGAGVITTLLSFGITMLVKSNKK